MRPNSALLVVFLVACGGTKFTGVPDEGGATAGDSDAATSDDAASDGSTLPEGGVACTWSASGGGCPGENYCDAPGCGAGTCVHAPKNDNTNLNLVCGCDQLTYYNDSVARSHSMSVASQGECKGAKACSTGVKCGSGSTCNIRVDGVVACTTNPSGTCWVLPQACPPPSLNPKMRQCGATSCADQCDLVKSGKPWYEDPLCP